MQAGLGPERSVLGRSRARVEDPAGALLGPERLAHGCSVELRVQRPVLGRESLHLLHQEVEIAAGDGGRGGGQGAILLPSGAV